MKRLLAALFLVAGLSAANADENKIPDALKGFSGQISGIIVKKEGNTLHIKVDTVNKVWKVNKAEKPESLIGQTIQVSEGMSKPKDSDTLVPNKNHVAFIGKVPLGKIEIEVCAGEDGKFHLMELSKEQRKLAGVE